MLAGVRRSPKSTHRASFLAKSTAQDIWTGLTQAVPNTKAQPFSLKALQTVSQAYFTTWRGAVSGENGFVPVFIPWFADPTYRETAPASFEPTPEEEQLIADHGLDYDQLQFRRQKIAQNGIDLFNQEYQIARNPRFSTPVARSSIPSSSPRCSMKRTRSNAWL